MGGIIVPESEYGWMGSLRYKAPPYWFAGTTIDYVHRFLDIQWIGIIE